MITREKMLLLLKSGRDQELANRDLILRDADILVATIDNAVLSGELASDSAVTLARRAYGRPFDKLTIDAILGRNDE